MFDFFIYSRISFFLAGFIVGIYLLLGIIFLTPILIGADYKDILSPFVILVSATISLIAFLTTIKLNQELASKKNTIDALNNFDDILFISTVQTMLKIKKLNPQKESEALKTLGNHSYRQ